MAYKRDFERQSRHFEIEVCGQRDARGDGMERGRGWGMRGDEVDGAAGRWCEWIRLGGTDDGKMEVLEKGGKDRAVTKL